MELKISCQVNRRKLTGNRTMKPDIILKKKKKEKKEGETHCVSVNSICLRKTLPTFSHNDWNNRPFENLFCSYFYILKNHKNIFPLHFDVRIRKSAEARVSLIASEWPPRLRLIEGVTWVAVVTPEVVDCRTADQGGRSKASLSWCGNESFTTSHVIQGEIKI